MVTHLHVKKNTTVEVISGRDRGKRGKVTQVFPQSGLVVVEGINLRVKHLKSRRSGQPGSKVQYAAPLPVSKVMAVCSHCAKPVRVRHTLVEGKRLRLCHRCQQPLTE